MCHWCEKDPYTGQIITQVCDMETPYTADSLIYKPTPTRTNDLPTIPEFVAKWIISEREKCSTLRQALDHYLLKGEIQKWLQSRDNQELFARAWLDGYRLERGKLYTVEIPNPHRKGKNRIFLQKDSNTGKILLCKGNFNPEKNKTLWLTEDEIKEDFAWTWNEKFAKEVK